MAVSWYPRHMNTARKEIERALPRTDAAVEILDARLPRSSRNPVLAELLSGKPRLVLLNKKDLADPKVTRAWLGALGREPRSEAAPIAATVRSEVMRALRRAQRMAGRDPAPGRPVRILVVGIPNVGKSTLLNSIVRRRVARVGDEPAVTKGQQVIEPFSGLRLIDTPGLLWPKLDDDLRAYRLAASGAIKDSAVDEAEVALFALGYLRVEYPDLLARRYRIDAAAGDPRALLDSIGRRRGCLVAGGDVDPIKAAQILLQDLRSGRLGRVSLERPD